MIFVAFLEKTWWKLRERFLRDRGIEREIEREREREMGDRERVKKSE